LTPILPPDLSPLELPKLPVFGWDAFRGSKDSALPCVLDHANWIYTGSGRAAIALALSTLGIGRGDTVLVPTYHCPTMVSPIVATGAEPLFFPIDSAGAPGLDVVPTLKLGRVRAMLAAHYFGLPQPMARVRQFCDGLRIALIEDCAHAMFGTADGRPVGGWGGFAIASLTKFFPVSDGGCLVFNAPGGTPQRPDRRSMSDEFRSAANAIELGAQYRKLTGVNTTISGLFAVANSLRPRRDPGVSLSSADVRDQSSLRDSMEDFGPLPLDSPDASLWSKWVARTVHRERIVLLRRRNYQYLARAVETIPGVRALMPQLPDVAAPYVFPLWAERPEASYQAIRAAGVPIFRWDQVWPGTPAIAGDFGVEWSTHVFQVGCHQDLSIDDLSLMVDRLRHIIADTGRSSRGSVATGAATVT
jgi:perosamine synthetase